ncbi:hypothetical protein HJ588_04270 [Flexivirga sp. ID2601S]|uniref:PKD domain-containing protein n=1 Tax=Flexivirga aerilata TaxID=1656889 RepID=A0A849AJB0_9MICO|nr:hypothetical protein [Flexivirga aerilata]NNG38490.1 hypothetical protein [Flexivirga aerilata]
MKTSSVRILSLCLAGSVASGIGFIYPVSALACGVLETKCVDDGGAKYSGSTMKQTSELPTSGKEPVTENGKTTVKTVPYEYDTAIACPGNSSPGDDVGCARAMTICVDVPDAVGPLVRIFFRPILPDGKRGQWRAGGETCWPNLVPGGASRPQLTVAMILQAFTRTPFAKPQVAMQPVGNRTLVNLPTYFRTVFPGAGWAPDEVRTVTLLGHQVRIKPVLKSNTYLFGDGSSAGPTTSMGGVWPTGDIKHTYTKTGSVTTQITTVYGGQFSVDGSDFQDLPGAATISGPTQALTVVGAKTRLVR